MNFETSTRPREIANSRAWIPAAAIVGSFYALVGILFALPQANGQRWRLAAWGVSAAAYAGHICYERFRLVNPPRRAALHVTLATALGAFGLAVGANIHALQIASTGRHHLLLIISLALWPLITAVPAFCIAFTASWILRRIAPGGNDARAR